MAERGNGREEVERYKRAAHEALHQLDLAIDVLRRYRQDKVALDLARSRTQIRERLSGADSKPVRGMHD